MPPDTAGHRRRNFKQERQAAKPARQAEAPEENAQSGWSLTPACNQIFVRRVVLRSPLAGSTTPLPPSRFRIVIVASPVTCRPSAFS